MQTLSNASQPDTLRQSRMGTVTSSVIRDAVDVLQHSATEELWQLQRRNKGSACVSQSCLLQAGTTDAEMCMSSKTRQLGSLSPVTFQSRAITALIPLGTDASLGCCGPGTHLPGGNARHFGLHQVSIAVADGCGVWRAMGNSAATAWVASAACRNSAGRSASLWSWALG